MKVFDCRINDKWILSDFDFQPSSHGFNPTLKILQGEHPTAIIYGADFLALGGMEAIKRSGFKIPEDISVVSFDDLPESATAFPPLTTMRLDTLALANLMVDSIEKLMLGRSHERKVFIDRQLIQRESVAICKSK
jgi:DNA-binding LacI/PurR family transcriptional regulator